MSEASSPAPRILVIDDEPQIRKFLEISLRSQGYAVTEAATGHEGRSGRPRWCCESTRYGIQRLSARSSSTAIPAS